MLNVSAKWIKLLKEIFNIGLSQITNTSTCILLSYHYLFLVYVKLIVQKLVTIGLGGLSAGQKMWHTHVQKVPHNGLCWKMLESFVSK